MGKSRVTFQAEIIGKNLKNLRKIRGISQAALAEILDVTVQQVQKYERGYNRLPIDKLHIAKEEMHVPYDFFFEGMGKFSHQPLKMISNEISKEVEQVSNQSALLDILGLIHTFKNYETRFLAKQAK